MVPAHDRDSGFATSGTRRAALWAGLAVCITVLFVASPVRNPFGDTSLTIPTASSLLNKGTLSLQQFEGSALLSHYAIAVVDGQPVNGFPWTVAIFAVPVVLLNDLLARFTPLESSYELVLAANPWTLEKVASSLVAAVAVVLAAELAYQRLGRHAVKHRLLWSIAIAGVFAVGTSLWSVVSRALWQHGPAMLLGLAALLVATRVAADPARLPERRVPFVVLGALAAFAYTVRPTYAVLLLFLGVWVGVTFWRRLVEYVVGAALVFGVWMAVNISNGLGAVPGYSGSGRLGLHGSVTEAILGNMISPARGLLIFSPFFALVLVHALLPASIRRSAEGDKLEIVAVAAFGAMWIGISLFPHWWGGHSFGPRLMSDSLPFLVLLSVPLFASLDQSLVQRPLGAARRSSLALALVGVLFVGWSVVTHAQGAVLSEPACWNRVPEDVDVAPERLWSLRDPQVTTGLRSVFGETYRTRDGSECFFV